MELLEYKKAAIASHLKKDDDFLFNPHTDSDSESD